MAKLIAALSILSHAIARGPADLISKAGLPFFKLEVDEGFKLSVSILVRTDSPNDEKPGKADFKISVSLPGTKTVSANCSNEVYFFDEGAMAFDPYGEDNSCTGNFRVAMNSILGPNVVQAPILLAWDKKDKSLTVSIGAEVKIPYMGNVNP